MNTAIATPTTPADAVQRVVRRMCQASNYERGGDPFDAPDCGVEASFMKHGSDPRLGPTYLCRRHAKQKRWNKGAAPIPLNDEASHRTTLAD